MSKASPNQKIYTYKGMAQRIYMKIMYKSHMPLDLWFKEQGMGSNLIKKKKGHMYMQIHKHVRKHAC